MQINRLNSYQINSQNKFQNKNQNSQQTPTFGKLIKFENKIGNVICEELSSMETKLKYSKLLETIANNEAIKNYVKKHNISIKLDNFETERIYNNGKTTVNRALGINIVDHEFANKITKIKSIYLSYPHNKTDAEIMDKLYKEADNLNNGTIFNFIAKGKSYNVINGEYEFADGLKAIKDSVQNLTLEKLEKNRTLISKKFDKLAEKTELSTDCRYKIHQSKNIKKALDEIKSWQNLRNGNIEI